MRLKFQIPNAKNNILDCQWSIFRIIQTDSIRKGFNGLRLTNPYLIPCKMKTKNK